LPEVICNTSPLQYLHQIGQLELVPRLVERIIVPTAVVAELTEGRRLGVDLPAPEHLPWVHVRTPSSEHAQILGIRLTGTLGILLDAKKRGLILSVTPLIEDLQRMGFRLSSRTREAVLQSAGEM
jgi:predicted nucleic acid-binding protein